MCCIYYPVLENILIADSPYFTLILQLLYRLFSAVKKYQYFVVMKLFEEFAQNGRSWYLYMYSFHGAILLIKLRYKPYIDIFNI